MNKEEVLEDFFRAFKVTLTNAFSYSKDHPYFIKSVDNLKAKLEAALQFHNPLKIGITDKAIFIDGKAWLKSGSYDDLARLLHQRKIKSIQLSSGLSVDEIIELLALLSLPQKEILQKGGLAKILEERNLTHVLIEDLDYSLFLGEKGATADKDIWEYLLKNALNKDNAAKVGDLADNFESMLQSAGGLDLLTEPEFPKSVNDLLLYLKKNDQQRFDKCAKDLFLWFMQNRKLLDNEKINRIRQIFLGLSKEDFINLLLDGLLSDEEFDSLSLELFAKISEEEGQEGIAQGVLKKINESKTLLNDPRLVRKIQGLLAAPQKDSVSAVYRNTLNLLLKEVSFTGRLFFDRQKLQENFRYLILNLLVLEKDKKNLSQICLILERELDIIFAEKSLNYLIALYDCLPGGNNEFADLFLPLEKKISEFVENLIWSQEFSAELENLVSKIDKPSLSLDFYLDKIFQEGKLDPFTLKVFFRFFGKDLSGFNARLNNRRRDFEFLIQLVDILKDFDPVSVSSSLRYIYDLSNHFVKIEVLKAMRKQKIDYAFVLSALNEDSPVLKKEAFLIISRETSQVKEGLTILLNIPDNWGKNNALIIENLQIIHELGIKEAYDYIKDLSKRRFFWNRNLRKKANQILKEWNAN